MVLPNFLIVGAQKSGTSTLKGYLCQHNDVFMPGGEAHFFDRDHNYNRGIEWYAELFKDASQQRAIGEKTSGYCYQPHVPERIHKHLPSAKLIWILRDPVARAYSHYWHAVKNGNERLSFESAVEAEINAVQNGKNNYRAHLGRGVYAEQITTYLRLFPKEQMHFVLLDDLVRSPESTLKPVYNFLGVSPEVKFTDQIKRNVGYKPRSIYFSWAFRQIFGEDRHKRFIKRRQRPAESGYPPMKEATRAFLKQYFKVHNSELVDWT